jgi:hypothetical protein
MNWRLDNIPIFELTDTAVPAADFNLVQTALRRLGEPIEIPLSGLRNLKLILDREAWIVVDGAMNDIPILAWTDFQSEGRSALHEPVNCRLKTYHQHASVILGPVTEFMEQELAKRLAERQSAAPRGKVTPLKKD